MEILQEDTLKPIRFPISLADLLKADIPPVNYIINPVLPENGKLLISASQGACKTFFALNIACAVSSGESAYLDNIELSCGRVLCVISEGGLAELKRRVGIMAKAPNIKTENCILSYEPCFNLSDGADKKKLIGYLNEFKPNLLILDSIGQLWHGKEVEKDAARTLTSFLDSLINEYNLSIILTHHWKKPTREVNSGGHMASGSYWWTAWVDGHITLQGDANKLILSFEKVRSGVKPSDKLILRLREEDFWLECIGKKGEIVSREQLDTIFNSFGSLKVKLNDLAKKAKEEGLVSRNTLVKAFKNNLAYLYDGTNKRCHYIVKREANDR